MLDAPAQKIAIISLLFLYLRGCYVQLVDSGDGVFRRHGSYDAQHVALSQSLNAPLITEDRKLRKAVP
jgi:predicted nucleic acid-binding protein